MNMKGIEANSKSTTIKTVACSVCQTDMDCPESMLGAKRHFCVTCTDLMAEGYEPEDITPRLVDRAQYFPICDNVAETFTDAAFDGFWAELQSIGMEHFSYEDLARECYVQGARSLLRLLVRSGVEVLDVPIG